MSERFFDQPILNSPCEPPQWHHDLDEDSQPTDRPPVKERRRSELLTPVPKSRKQRSRQKAGQTRMDLGGRESISDADQEYNPTPIINEIRQQVEDWRNLRNPLGWQVTPATARLLPYWRRKNWEGIRPFFCQVEAVETIIWRTEVAPNLGQRGRRFWSHVQGANQQANPGLLRLAMKMYGAA